MRKMDNPTISTCLIVYNQADYVRDCIDGALMQKTDYAYEIVIGDDCSTDRTSEICKKYAEEYPNLIRYFRREKNLGMIGNWAETIKNCNGKYIALCEGDDYWTDPFKLQKQVDFLEENEEYAAIFHNAQISNAATNTTELYRKEWNNSDEVSAEQIIKGGGGIYPTAALMFRTNSNKYCSYFPETQSGDTVLSLSLLLSGKFFFHNEVMSVYRIHSKGVYSEIVLSNDILKFIRLWLSNIEILKCYDSLSEGGNRPFVKEAIIKYYIRILRVRKIKLPRDFRYLIKIPIRDALYLIKSSANSKK